MTKKSDVRNAIKRVMADVSIESQAEFSKLLGFRPSTVSAWMTGSALPSPDAWMALGTKAKKAEDALFCYERAGLTKDAILSASRKLISGGLAPEREGEVVRIRPYNQGSERDSGAILILPLNMVPNPDSTYFLNLVDDQFWFAAGDTLVLDTAGADSLYLKAFLGQVVAVGPVSRGQNPMVGRLYLGAGRDGQAAARLTSVGGLAVGSTTFTVAEYQVPPSAEGQEAWDQASEKMPQNPAIPILGRVIAYIPGEGLWES